MDTTYQTQLKEIKDLNWARMQLRFDAFDARMTAFEARIEGRMDAHEARNEATFQSLRVEMVRWMFTFWTATVIPIIGVMLALSGAFRG